MSTVVQNIVNTKYTADTSGASLAMMGMSRATQNAGSLMGGLSDKLKYAFPAALAAAGFGFGISAIARLGAQFENTANLMGGTLAALGFAEGAKAADKFKNGLQVAEHTMHKIRAASALLPGEADDYIAVFKQALPMVQGAIGGSLDQMTDFTNKATAIGKSFGIDSMQIGMDLTRMLGAGKGSAGMDNRTWTTLLPFINAVKGQEKVTSESFNKLTQAKRGAILNATFGSLDEVIKAAGNTYDAQIGGLHANAHLIMQQASAPLFEAMKKGLSWINAHMADANGNLIGIGKTVTDVGRFISEYIVKGFDAGSVYVDMMSKKLHEMSAWIKESPIGGLISNAGAFIGGAQTALQDSFAGASAGGVAGLVALTLAFGPLTAGVVMLTGGIQPMMSIFENLGGILWDFGISVIPPLVEAFINVYRWLQPVIAGFATLVGELLGRIRPALAGFSSAVGGLISAIGNYLGPYLRILGEAALWLASKIGDVVVPIFTTLVGVLTWGAGVLTSVFNFLGGLMGTGAQTLGFAPAALPTGEGGLGFFGKMIADFSASRKAAEDKFAASEAAASGGAGPGAKTPAARGGAKVNQDFRYSRFDISQKFEEGFDPDRIAVLFAEDVGRIGHTNSGLEPTTGMR